MRVHRLLTTLCLCLLTALWTALPACASHAPILPCEVINAYPHNPRSSTQGLFYFNGVLYESSGGYGESLLAIVDLKTGDWLKTQPLESRYFAEGIAHDGKRLLLLTWMSGTGFVHSIDSLNLLATFAYRPNGDTTEGWGLTHDGDHFISSSGSARLRTHSTDDFALTGSILVRDGEKPIRMLNELEYVGGMVLANIWKSDLIAVINPTTGVITAWIDLSPLRKRIRKDSGVANGIAYDSEKGRLFVTGKHWDMLFEISVDDILWRKPVVHQ